MHSSFKTKHNLNRNRQHSFHPYSKNSPSRNTCFRGSFNHEAQEFQNPSSHYQLGHGNLPPPLSNSSKKMFQAQQANDALPLKLVFSKAVNLSSKKMEYNVGPNMYFRRSSPPLPEISKKRLPLANLLGENPVEPVFRSDNLETFRSLSCIQKSTAKNDSLSDKENDFEMGDSFEKLQLTPPPKQITSYQRQRNTKHMFDFSPETRIGTRCSSSDQNNSDRYQQNKRLMTSADFLVSSRNFRSARSVASDVSSPLLSDLAKSDDNDCFFENSCSNLATSPVRGSGSKCSNLVKALEMFSFNERMPDSISLSSSPSQPLPPRSPDFHMLSTTASGEDFGGNQEYSFNWSGFDDRLQDCSNKLIHFGEIYNQEGSVPDNNGIERGLVDRRCYHEGSSHSSNQQNYDGIGRGLVDRRCYHEGSGRNSVVSTQNCSNGRSLVDKRFSQKNSCRNSGISTQSFGSGRSFMDGMYNQGARDCSNDINNNSKNNLVDRRINQENFEYDPEKSLCKNYYSGDNSRNYDNCHDNDSDRCSFSSETVIPQHLVDLWRSEFPLSESCNFEGRQSVDRSSEMIEINSSASSSPEVVPLCQYKADKVEGRVNCATRTSKQALLREPMFSYPDEE